jgi:phosphotransferase system  glucose/maltose/N-acetylglucosamine-specific IIC component
MAATKEVIWSISVSSIWCIFWGMLQLGRSKLSKILFESGCFDTWLHNKLYTMLLSPSIYSNVNHVKIIAFWFNSPSCSHIKKTILLNYLCIGSIANDHVNIILHRRLVEQ